MALILVVFAVGGVVCGLCWEWWWTPPTGSVVEHVWHPDREGVGATFSGSAIYFVVAVAGGLLLGAACAWLFDRVELVTLVAVAAGSVLAAWLMFQTGTAAAPPDPRVAAADLPDETRLPGTLEVSGRSPFVAFPMGSLAGLSAVFVGMSPTRRSRR